jgi:hypothetical protein
MRDFLVHPPIPYFIPEQSIGRNDVTHTVRSGKHCLRKRGDDGYRPEDGRIGTLSVAPRATIRRAPRRIGEGIAGIEGTCLVGAIPAAVRKLVADFLRHRIAASGQTSILGIPETLDIATACCGIQNERTDINGQLDFI